MGAFVLPFDWLQGAGLAGVVLGFGVATVLILVVGLVYATAIRALPRTGGGVLFALFSAGRIPGFIAGWSLALGCTGIVAMNASAVTLIFRVTFPGSSPTASSSTSQGGRSTLRRSWSRSCSSGSSPC